MVNEIISLIKSGGDDVRTQALWNRLMENIAAEDIEYVVVACTDLSPMMKYANKTLKYIDSAKALAAAVVRAYLLRIKMQ